MKNVITPTQIGIYIAITIFQLSNCLHRDPWTIHTVGNFPLFFEEIGTTIFYHNDWTVITKIPRTDFSSAISHTKACIKELKKFCKFINDYSSDVDSAIQTNCNTTSDSITQFLNNIARQINELDHVFWKVRHKRELTSVGRFLKWAFGTMDKNDAKYIYRKLGILTNTTGRSLTIHDRQITLLKASYQDLSQPILHLESNINTVKEQINYQTEYLNNTVVQQNMDVYWLKYEMRAQSLINRLLISMTSISHYVNKELMIINELYHNRLPLGILSKNILSELYHNISVMVQTHSEFGTFYALHLLTSVTISMTDNDIFIYLKIPLPGNDEYTLRQIYRLPQRLDNGQSFILDIVNDYVAEGERQSMLLSRDQVHKCHHIDLNGRMVYVCHAHGVWLSSEANDCVMILLQNPKITPKVCHYKVMNQSLELFLPMQKSNLWLFSFVTSKEFRIACDSKRSTLILKNVGILQLRKDCLVWTDDIVLPFFRKGHSTVDVQSVDQLMPVNSETPKGQLNLPQLKSNTFLAQKLVVTDFNQLQRIITDRMKDMNELHRETRQSQAMYKAQSENDRLKSLQYFTLGTSLTSLSLSTILIIILVGVVLYYKKCKGRKMAGCTNGVTSVIIPSSNTSELLVKKTDFCCGNDHSI